MKGEARQAAAGVARSEIARNRIAHGVGTDVAVMVRQEGHRPGGDKGGLAVQHGRLDRMEVFARKWSQVTRIAAAFERADAMP